MASKRLWIPASVALLITAALLVGCGGDDETFVPTKDKAPTNLPGTFLRVAPGAGFYPQFNGGNTELSTAGRTIVMAPGYIIPGQVTFDTPELTALTNQPLVLPGASIAATITWSDVGGDVDTILAELRCAGGVLPSVLPVHAEIPVPEFVGLSSGTTGINLAVHADTPQAGMEIILALRDRQGHVSQVIRSVVVVTQFANHPDLAPATSGLTVTGGESPPMVDANWTPTAGTILDTIPSGQEGNIPSRVTGNVHRIFSTTPGTSNILLTDVGQFLGMQGVAHGSGNKFCYLICRQGIAVADPTTGQPMPNCAGTYAILGVGETIEEFRQGFPDRRLVVTEMRIFLGTFDPFAPQGTPMGDPDDTIPLSCPRTAFDLKLISESISYYQ